MSSDAFEYAVLRVVPRVERGERINVGVILYCRTFRFLGARILLDDAHRAALRALAPDADLGAIEAHLAVIDQIVRGEPGVGPIAALPAPERFRWATSPSSTIIQPSEVHGGITDDPQATLEQIFASQVG